jgi:hypothetical protein
MTKRERQALAKSRLAHEAKRQAEALTKPPFEAGTLAVQNAGTAFEVKCRVESVSLSKFGYSYRVTNTEGPYEGCTFHVPASRLTTAQ